MNPRFTLTELLQVTAVEAIRHLWDRGHLIGPDWAWVKMIHDNWFDLWVEYKTALVMASVDEQVEKIQDGWAEIARLSQKPEFSEVLHGDTPLGGPMQSSHPSLGTFDPLEADTDLTDIHP